MTFLPRADAGRTAAKASAGNEKGTLGHDETPWKPNGQEMRSHTRQINTKSASGYQTCQEPFCPGMSRLAPGMASVAMSRGNGSRNTFIGLQSNLTMGAIMTPNTPRKKYAKANVC